MLKVTRASVCVYNSINTRSYYTTVHYILFAINCEVVCHFLIYNKPRICNILCLLAVSEKPHYIKPWVYNESNISTKTEFIISTLIELKKIAKSR